MLEAVDVAPFQDFLAALDRATNETQKRESFIVLAASGFSDTELATHLALGAEHQVRFEKAGPFATTLTRWSVPADTRRLRRRPVGSWYALATSDHTGVLTATRPTLARAWIIAAALTATPIVTVAAALASQQRWALLALAPYLAGLATVRASGGHPSSPGPASVCRAPTAW